MQHLILVKVEPSGQFTARAVGIPEIQETAASKEEAIQKVQRTLAEWMEAGQLVSVEVTQRNGFMGLLGHSKNDPDFKLYLEEIQKYRQEVDARECSDSSSTPTT